MAGKLDFVTCWICTKPIPLQGCTTHALGYPVHEKCYAEMLTEEKKKRQVAKFSDNKRGSR
jgi:hypothetical protein